MTQHFLTYLIILFALLSSIASVAAIIYYKRFLKAKHDYRYISRQLDITTQAYYAFGKKGSEPISTTAA